MVDDPELVLHVWPTRWDLPSFTPACLASVLYLQVIIPGKFVLEETTNPDLSPDGRLPYLTHRNVSIASYPSIVEYVDGLLKQNGSSSDQQQAQGIAWMAYVSAHLGDLVACSFFTLRHNYFECVRPSLSELFPIPLRYYVPDRLREIYKPRLEAAGLWTVHTEEAEEEKRKKMGILGLASNTSVEEAFGKEKVLEKGRAVFDLLARRLGDKRFFLNNQEPTALDALVAAHIILLTTPLPNDLLRSLVTESYPSLLTHARKLYVRTISRQLSHGRSASLSSSYDIVESETQVIEHVVPLQVRSTPSVPIPEVITSLLLPVSWRPTVSSIETKDKLGEDEEPVWEGWALFGAGVLGIIGWALFRS
ncbi:uncharacterized protein FOMMEDRAFT_109896 [Fomitiporia mediterranea MF3/22]|uniref:uncharacterized protein n=1 Tax=Fomitiporia mediterranea (strain MF3/22) TaxID=694068 RepID=UPI0004408C1F|nr:uncharacterized protein FOMMEDRAFT_109896 [Fomitiporia mediterranea MF3/22]EJD02483.1 hypothetical protein FOMMEDRAFT_109896 [Fomitiporia mediterranea MF3/22]